jgi:UDP-N-acetylmuramoyl-L-alanyl-D-glutamate--2,6-diaminopimelate ligase
MRLDELIDADALDVRGVSPGAGGVEIASLAYDSRAVRPGALFFCVSGLQADGHEFAAQALAAGASALVVERPLDLDAPQVLAGSARAAMGPIAARFYGDPTRELRVVGVTGTNGKTTSCYLVRALMEAEGVRCGLLGTVKSVIAGRERAALRTTPEAIDLQGSFRAMIDGGERACAMEVSSHALALGRTDGVRFAAAIFTNLTQDHLDFHESMEDYFGAKRRLFVAGPPGVAVVNVDDPYGRRLADELDGAVTFAVERDADADYRARDLAIEDGGWAMTIETPGGSRRLKLAMTGRFNVYNALGALAACHSLGGDLDALVGALERGVRVPGRVERVQEGQDFEVLVDYAHTPDSLENVLGAVRETTSGRVICVFGAGGDRDRTKRPLMGEIGARLADVAIVTSDNPRSEPPEAILAEVMRGAARAQRPVGALPVRAEVDRRAAIERALAAAQAGDAVVIAGKGHEQGQELAGGVKVAFDDVSVAREALRARMGARAA